MNYLNLVIFDLHVCLATNEAGLLIPIATIFQRFITPIPTADYQLYCKLIVEQDSLVITMEGKLVSRVQVADFRPILPLILDRLLFDIISQIDSHIMLHAGMLSIDGMGVAIVADSMQGKTTLTSGMAQFSDTHFMSDESAALQLNQPIVDAFPRAVSIRPKTLGLLNIDPAQAFEHQDKYYIDPEILFGKPICAQVELNHVFVVSADSPSQSNKLLLRINAAPNSLQKQFTDLDGVQTVQFTQHNGLWSVLLTAHDIHKTYQQTTQISAEHGILILDIQTHSLQKPDFARSPAIVLLSRADTALQLLHHFQAGLHSTLITEKYAGDESKLFLALLRSLAKAQCYQLTIGNLAETIALVRATVQSYQP